MIAPLDTSAKRCGDLHRESYESWIRRFCRERDIPWRDEYATPMDERPVAPARQDRPMAGVRKGVV